MLNNTNKQRENGFTFFRFIFALFVLYSHSYTIVLGPTHGDFLSGLAPFSLGTIGVYGFFGISGYLVTKSFFSHNGSLSHFFMARILRIMPALIVVVILTALIVGPILTEIPLFTYLSSRDVYGYIINNLIILFYSFNVQCTLPGVFLENTLPLAVNDSLWTIPYEVLMYAIIATLGAVIIRLHKHSACYILGCMWAIFFFISVMGFGPPFGFATRFYEFGLCFFMGSWMSVVKINKWYYYALGICIVFCLCSYFIVFRSAFSGLFILFLIGSTLLFGKLRIPVIWRMEKVGDLSYGIYLYAFPIQQCLIALSPPGYFSVQMHALCSSLIAIFIGFLSWHFVEKRILVFKSLGSFFVGPKKS